MPIVLSALLHAALLTTFLLVRPAHAPIMPPMYRVSLVAAPAAPRAVGVVNDAPVPAPAKPTAKTPPKAVSKAVPPKTASRSKIPTKAPVQATPSLATRQPPPKAADQPRAGGGERGDRGADVASVSTAGIVFPYKGYTDNIVRQIALNFAPRGNVGALRAEVAFFIRRDGSVYGFRWLTRSGNMAFDLEAQGAVESAARAFGPLPAGFADDVLPIIFYFDPSKLR